MGPISVLNFKLNKMRILIKIGYILNNVFFFYVGRYVTNNKYGLGSVFNKFTFKSKVGFLILKNRREFSFFDCMGPRLNKHYNRKYSPVEPIDRTALTYLIWID